MPGTSQDLGLPWKNKQCKKYKNQQHKQKTTGKQQDTQHRCYDSMKKLSFT